MKLIDNQLERVKIVGTNKTECGCSIRTTHGLPCACELAKLQINGNAIPLDSIHDFWKQQQSQSSQHSFKTQFPTYIRPYIEDIVDVVADGNCGFRAIAALLGWTEESWALVRSQLDKEIGLHKDVYSNVFDDNVESVRNSLKISKLGAQGKDKWMSLPDLGYVIATLYNVILVSLSRNLNMTFFPLNKSPSKETFGQSLLAIGFVNENHWVQIKLKSDCPLPPTSQKWKDFCSDTAKSWEVAYAARMKHWERIDPSFIRSSCISLNED
uniref:Uncharacterized protein LOC105851939 n=1 Tax=Cicer arietinum TaxID=3827 RepID=A0A3Q7XYJ6_CICAR|nr:uncharacterized protein LOC105851939 [Cicer arietinum]